MSDEKKQQSTRKKNCRQWEDNSHILQFIHYQFIRNIVNMTINSLLITHSHRLPSKTKQKKNSTYVRSVSSVTKIHQNTTCIYNFVHFEFLYYIKQVDTIYL